MDAPRIARLRASEPLLERDASMLSIGRGTALRAIQGLPRNRVLQAQPAALQPVAFMLARAGQFSSQKETIVVACLFVPIMRNQ